MAVDTAIVNANISDQQKLQEIIDLLVAAGYFRARIKGLSPFDKVRRVQLLWFSFEADFLLPNFLNSKRQNPINIISTDCRRNELGHRDVQR